MTSLSEPDTPSDILIAESEMVAEGGHIEPTMEEKEAAYEKFVWENLRRNYIGNFLHGMLGMTGFRLLNAPTFLPAYLHALAGSDAIVGLGLAVQQFGAMLSPGISANMVEHRAKVLPIAQVIGFGMRIPVLFIALGGWFLPPNVQLPMIMTLLFIFGLFSGMQRVAFGTLMAKVIPVTQRGRLSAWRNVVGGAIAAVLAFVAGKYLIAGNVWGNGYSTTFLLAFFLMTGGLSIFSLLVREPIPPRTRTFTPMRERLRQLPGMFRSEPEFTWYTIVVLCAVMGRLAVPFYILYAAKTIELSGANIGILSLAYLGADTASNLLWGYLGDKKGFRIVLLLALGSWIAATVLLMNVTALWPIALAFVGLGASQAGYLMASQTMVLEFGSREDTPMRLAITGTAEQVSAAAGPLIGGLIAAVVGYHAVFQVSIAFLVLSLILVIVRVKEPRKRSARVRS
ncbi:MFS transporter [Phenylobacterium immobile]|uniref:MFS transporter n=1 Tax=Phenylobacterium immobile TaxID=21 RepID=UPI000A867980|nr:MFS transporter [Phenylobacterium immobile]